MKPPVFYPRKPLKAEDLIGLENYLISRHSLISKDHGILDMHVPQYQDASFAVHHLSGIATDGSPVKLERGEYIVAPNASKNMIGELSIADFYLINKQPIIDPEYVINNLETIAHDPRFAKHTIHTVHIQVEDALVQILPNSLYLGRYQYGGPEIKMIDPPFFYNLFSAKSFLGDDKWRDWTIIIRDAMSGVLDRSANNPFIQYKLSELIFNYHSWPINTLFQNCIEISWLSGITDFRDALKENNMMTLLQNQQAGYNDPYLPKDLPTQIRNLLGPGPTSNLTLFKPKDYTTANHKISFTHDFKGDVEFCFHYMPPLPKEETYYALEIISPDKRTEVFVPHIQEKNNVGQMESVLKFIVRNANLQSVWTAETVGVNQDPYMIRYSNK